MGNACWEDRIGYALKRAYQAQRTALDDVLRDLGLTTAQWGALKCLQMHEGLTSAELARMACCTPQTMNDIVLHLEKAGLVERQPHPTHGTILPAHLTVAGSTVLIECDSRVEAIEERMLSKLDASERRQLLDALNRCTEALQSETGVPPSAAIELGPASVVAE